MSATNTGEARKVDGKSRLLDAARNLFAQGGFEDTSVSQILNESGLKAPSLYHHFQDKEGLYTAWAMTVLEEAGCRIKESTPTDLASLARLITAGATFDYLQMERDLRKIADPQNRLRIERAVQKNLVDPVLTLLTKLERTPLNAALFLHMAMLHHPAYSGGTERAPADLGFPDAVWDRLFVRAE